MLSTCLYSKKIHHLCVYHFLICMFVLSSSLTIFIYRNKRRPEARIVLTFYYWKERSGSFLEYSVEKEMLSRTNSYSSYWHVCSENPRAKHGFCYWQADLVSCQSGPFALIKKMYPDMTINKQLFLKTEMCVVAQGYCHSCCYSRQRLLLSDRKLNFMANM